MIFIHSSDHKKWSDEANLSSYESLF